MLRLFILGSSVSSNENIKEPWGFFDINQSGP